MWEKVEAQEFGRGVFGLKAEDLLTNSPGENKRGTKP